MSTSSTPPTAAGARIAAALGTLLNRRTRVGLYREITTAAALPAVDPTTYPLLSGIHRLGPATASSLAQSIGLERSVLSRYADRLEAAGLVHRVPDPADRRAHLLTLTAQGRSAAQRLHALLAEQIATRTAHWPRHEVENFAAGLERFIADLGR